MSGFAARTLCSPLFRGLPLNKWNSRRIASNASRPLSALVGVLRCGFLTSQMIRLGIIILTGSNEMGNRLTLIIDQAELAAIELDQADSE